MFLQKSVFTRLRNKEAHGLGNQMAAIMNGFDTATLGMDGLKQELTEANAFMTAAQVQVLSSIETPAIAEANDKRVSCYGGLRTIISAYAYRKDEALRSASALLSTLFKAYGPARDQGSYLALTNNIDNLLTDLKDNADYAAAIATLGVGDWVTELEEAQAAFVELFDKRVEQKLRNTADERTAEGRELIWNAISRTERYLELQSEFGDNADHKAMYDKWASYAKHITATYLVRTGKAEDVVTTEAEDETAPTELEESTV